MKSKLRVYVIGILTVVLVVGVVYFARLASFPGTVRTPAYKAEVQGIKTTFHAGVAYRYAGLPPFCEVTGNHHEMGLQYGVLLRPEIMRALDSYKKIVRWQAAKMGIPTPVLMAVAKYKAIQFSKRLPERFREEFKGLSEGSGVPEDTIIAISLFYDVGEGMCTGLLMKGAGGTVIQGRNQDATGFGGEEIGKMTVIVRYNAEGYNSITQFDWPLYMGIETGYNNKGLAFAEETLKIRHPNPAGFSIIYLARIALETCARIEELYPLFDKYPVVGAYGTVWSDRDEGRGIVAELTAHGWAAQELKTPLLWNFNRIYDAKLYKLQAPRSNIAGSNFDRDYIASGFPHKPVYTVKDAVDFLRAQKTSQGIDYSWYGSREAVCNAWAQQMIIFDPKGDGAYVALGQYYAARQKVYHIHDDFSKPPELVVDAIPLAPVVEEAAQIENLLLSDKDRLPAWVDLAQKYAADANAQFMAAYNGYKQGRIDLLAAYAPKAYALNPAVPEYRLYAGMAAYHQGEMEQAQALLEGVQSSDLYPEQEIYRLNVLEKAWASSSPEKSAQYRTQREALLAQFDAQEYYQSKLLPRLDKLSAKK